MQPLKQTAAQPDNEPKMSGCLVVVLIGLVLLLIGWSMCGGDY